MSDVTLSTSAVNAMCDALVDLIDVGTEYLSGTGLSATLQLTSAGGTPVIAVMEFASLTSAAFSSASGGVCTGILADEESAITSGDVGAFTITDGNSATILSGSVGVSGADININDVAIAEGDRITMTTLTITMPATSGQEP